MQSNRRPGHAGIVVKHRGGCPAAEGGGCRCKPAYQASVWSARERRRIRKHFPSLAAAKAWRQDALVALRKGQMKAPTRTTVEAAAAAWLEGVREGTIVNRKREPYKPSAIRSYDRALRLRVLPELGQVRLSDLTRNDVQDLVDRLLGQGLDPSTIQNMLNPLQAIYRRAVQRGEVAVNPTERLEVPRARGRRDRIASPEEAERLLGALSEDERALWATALYAACDAGSSGLSAGATSTSRPRSSGSSVRGTTTRARSRARRALPGEPSRSRRRSAHT